MPNKLHPFATTWLWIFFAEASSPRKVCKYNYRSRPSSSSAREWIVILHNCWWFFHPTNCDSKLFSLVRKLLRVLYDTLQVPPTTPLWRAAEAICVGARSQLLDRRKRAKFSNCFSFWKFGLSTFFIPFFNLSGECLPVYHLSFKRKIFAGIKAILNDNDKKRKSWNMEMKAPWQA